MTAAMAMAATPDTNAQNGPPLETALQGQTYAMIGERERLHQEHSFLKHYVEMSRQMAEKQLARAEAGDRALLEQETIRQRLMEDLKAAQLELNNHKVRLRVIQASIQRDESSAAEVRRR